MQIFTTLETGEKIAIVVLTILVLIFIVIAIITFSTGNYTTSVIFAFLGLSTGGLTYYWYQNPQFDLLELIGRRSKKMGEITRGQGEDDIEETIVDDEIEGGNGTCPQETITCNKCGSDDDMLTELEATDDETLRRLYESTRGSGEKRKRGSHEEELLCELEELIKILKSTSKDKEKLEKIEEKIKETKMNAEDQIAKISELLKSDDKVIIDSCKEASSDVKEKILAVMSYLTALARDIGDKSIEISKRLNEIKSACS